MLQQVVIVDYKMGNLFSIYKKVKRLGYNVCVSSDKKEIEKSAKIILPGVGHFGKAIENIRDLNVLDVLTNEILVKKKPILGICLGMQLMAEYSEEGNIKGFGWISGNVERFEVNDKLNFKIPHTGWNQINIEKQSILMNDIPNLSEFYFVHSYYLNTKDSKIILNTTAYENSFVSAIEKDNIFGVQYHPEKSHDVGEQLLKNFLKI